MTANAECIFCKIVAGQIPAEKVWEDDLVLGFKDIHPEAPFHALLIPKEHIATLDDLEQDHEPLMGRLIWAASRIASEEGLSEGYRLVTNCRAAAGQEVFHIHVHLLGGRPFGWPPG